MYSDANCGVFLLSFTANFFMSVSMLFHVNTLVVCHVAKTQVVALEPQGEFCLMVLHLMLKETFMA